MYTLLLRLSAPLQSWGDDSKYEIRKTWEEPSKSGVVGMIASALGRERSEDISDISTLRFGTRSDIPGRIIYDFHNYAPEGKGDKQNVVSWRYYIEDGTFLAGIESEDKIFLDDIEDALHFPYYGPLYLGRRSCPVTLPLTLGIRDKDLETALMEEPWIASDWMKKVTEIKSHGQLPPLKVMIEAKANEKRDGTRKDLPISFSRYNRIHARRGYKIIYKMNNANAAHHNSEFNHDIISEL